MQHFMELMAVEDAAEREQLLAERCGGDADLRQRVRQMLDADQTLRGRQDRADSFLSRAVQSEPEADAPAHSAEATGGQYRLLRVIGEGGMGVVYEAEQIRPRRRVAIKAIRADRRSASLRKRFEFEAQTLAQLEHPGIARLYECDLNPADRSVGAFLAMELVDGMPIDQFVTENKLPTSDRLRLFLRLCDAIAYAHRVGVIHRDLKPANILVTHEGQPKVLDFGVARNEQLDRSRSHHTLAGLVVGTLAYMSPEQLDASPRIDTRSDVFSLGVILYQLLSGRLPIEISADGLSSAIRRLGNERPPRLSSLDPSLRGDLDAIVQRALARDVQDRYDSVEQLAGDVQKHLEGRAVSVRSSSTLYVVGRSLRRHRVLAVSVAAAVALVIGFSIYAVDLARQATAARVLAEQSEAQTRLRAEEVRRALYFANIGYASAALERNDIGKVQSLLDQSPDDLRGWEWGVLRRWSDRSRSTIDLHMDGVWSANFSSDGNRIAMSASDTTIVVYDFARQTELLRDRVTPHGARIAIAPDGRSVVFSEPGCRLTHINLDTGARTILSPPALPPEQLNRTIRGLFFSPDSMRVSLFGDAGLIVTWSLDDPSASPRLVTVGPILLNALATRDDRFVIAVDHDGFIHRIDRQGAVTKLNTQSLGSSILSVVLNDDESRLVVGTRRGRLVVLPIDQTDATPLADLLVPGGAVWSVAFFGNDRMVLAGGNDNVLRLYDLDAQRESVQPEPAPLRGHSRPPLRLLARPDGSLISAGIDGTIRTWQPRLADDVPRIRPASTPINLAFSGDSLKLVTSDGAVVSQRVDLSQPMQTAGRHGFAGFGVVVDEVAGRYYTCGRDGRVMSWRTADDTPIAEFENPDGRGLFSIRLTPDRKQVWAGSITGKLYLLDAESLMPIDTMQASDALIYDIQFSPDASTLVTAGQGGTLTVWDMPARTRRLQAQVDRTLVYACLFAPDGNLLVAGESDGVNLLDIKTLNRVRSFQGHQGATIGLARHPDGKRFASSGADGTIRLWDFDSGAEILTLRGHRNIVGRLAFSADGKTLASASDDGTVGLWHSD